MSIKIFGVSSLLLFQIALSTSAVEPEARLLLTFREAVAARDFIQFSSMFRLASESDDNIRSIFDEVTGRGIDDIGLVETDWNSASLIYEHDGRKYRLPAKPNKDLKLRFPAEGDSHHRVVSYRVWRVHCDTAGCKILLGTPVGMNDRGHR